MQHYNKDIPRMFFVRIDVNLKMPAYIELRVSVLNLMLDSIHTNRWSPILENLKG